MKMFRQTKRLQLLLNPKRSQSLGDNSTKQHIRMEGLFKKEEITKSRTRDLGDMFEERCQNLFRIGKIMDQKCYVFQKGRF